MTIYPDFLTVHYGGSELFVVPSMHFNHVFAWEVNKICSHLNTDLDAIAVELGADIVLAARNWIGELGAGSEDPKALPVMLGIMKQNRMIRASLKEKVLQLQKETGKDLSELSPEMLHREIGFSGYSVLFLSPVDSIIEAIRCGIELNIPIYGIDLEEMADSIFRTIHVHDPLEARRNFTDYIVQNAPFAQAQRDDEIDCRREIAMAARLKALLKDYRRVLFVCGMAHWLEIKRLLDDSSIRPAVIPDGQAGRGFKRVVVHPQIAVRYMDLFPRLAAAYEKGRMPVNRASKEKDKKGCLDPVNIFYNDLRKTCKRYFAPKNQGLHPLKCNLDLENIQNFETYLANLCMLNYRSVPDLFMATRSAQELMSHEYSQAFVDVFMRFPWATPKKFPDYDILSPPRNSGDGSDCAVLSRDNIRDGKHFYIRSVLNNNNDPVSAKIPYEWKKTGYIKWEMECDPLTYSWLPWERLITSMSLRAVKYTRKIQDRKAENFEGSLMEGIDIKTTIRSYSRGRECLYVKDISEEALSYAGPLEGFPVVWILGPDESKGSEWIVLQEPSAYMERYIKDRDFLKKVTQEHGDKMVAIIAYGKRLFTNGTASKKIYIKTDKYQGIVIFQPLSWTHKQYARWTELTHYRSNPFYRDNLFGGGFPDSLANYYKNNHGTKIGEHRWSTTMILMALPFAKDVLTVVTPHNYHVDRVVYEKAQKYRVKVNTAPVNLFSQAEIERLSLCHLVPVITHEPCVLYSEAVEEAIGEYQTDNLHLVPQSLQDFGNDEY